MRWLHCDYPSMHTQVVEDTAVAEAWLSGM